MSKVYLLIYDSESDCDDLVGVYATQELAVKKAITLNRSTCECEVGSCDCDRLVNESDFITKSMYWGPALCVGSFYYVVERIVKKEVHSSENTENTETTEERFSRIEMRLDELDGEISHLQK